MITSDEFLLRFFAEGNNIWPGLSQSSPAARTLAPFLQALAYPGECPVILPRQRLVGLPSEVYIIGRDTAHAGRVRSLLEASVAHHWVSFDGRVATLNPDDPVDKAVLDFRGPGTTFVLKPNTQDAAAATLRALHRLANSLVGRPLRTPPAVRPVGRMLREFDLALSSGAVEASESLLREIQSVGGISHENVAFLRVRRLSRLGLEADLLVDGSLTAMVYTEPPFQVREAVLGAWARTKILPVLDSDGMNAALAGIPDGDVDFAMLVDRAMLRTTDDDVATVCALVAYVRGDDALAASFVKDRTLTDELQVLAVAEPGLETASDTEVRASTGPTSWMEWIEYVANGADTGLGVDDAETWAPAWTIDNDLAAAIYALPELAEDSLLDGVATLLETDDTEHAAPETAASLINRYLLSERFDPADLSALCALLQVFVRSGPAPDRYDELLSDIREYTGQWVSVQAAVKVIDIADAVACGPSGTQRDSFVSALLGPLNAQKSRLSATMRGLAALVSEDLNLALDWSLVVTDGGLRAAKDATADVAPRILIYSLDTGTLARTKAAISQQWPKAVVEASSDKVGNSGLKRHARNSDVIVLATRRASHAATGFITMNARTSALIGYADGSGSASMLRAVESTIGEWST